MWITAHQSNLLVLNFFCTYYTRNILHTYNRGNQKYMRFFIVSSSPFVRSRSIVLTCKTPFYAKDPSSTTTYSNGKIGTPLFDQHYSGPGTNLFWILQPELSGLQSGIVFRVPIVEDGGTSCDSTVIFRSGIGSSDTIVYQTCLDEIDMSPEGFFIPTETGVRVEFETTDAKAYGFMAKFETGMQFYFCLKWCNDVNDTHNIL